jgi:hypothetical protein
MIGAYDVTSAGSTGTSRSARPESSSSRSAATSARSTRPISGCTSSSTTSVHTSETRSATRRTRLAYTPHYGSWLNRIEAQFKALRYFTLDGTDDPDHATQARLIRRYIAWRNHHANDTKLRAVLNTANVA